MNPRYALIWGIFLASLSLEFSDCKKPVDPSDIEAGITVVDSTCRFLQGITSDGNIIAVCATIEEIAFVVAILAPLLDKNPPPKADCQHIPNTDLCATPEQMGVGIQKLIMRRRAMLLLDGGF